jgi:hypothetical protein
MQNVTTINNKSCSPNCTADILDRHKEYKIKARLNTKYHPNRTIFRGTNRFWNTYILDGNLNKMSCSQF